MSSIQSITRLDESSARAENTEDFYFVSIDGFQENYTEAQNLANPTKSQDNLPTEYCDLSNDEPPNSTDHLMTHRTKQQAVFNPTRKKRKRKQTKQEKKMLCRERRQKEKESLSPEELEMRRIKANRRRAELRAQANPKEEKLIKIRKKKRTAIRRANETAEEREERLAKNAQYVAERRRAREITPEERKRINALVKQRRDEKIAKETPEERKERLAEHARKVAERRRNQNISPEERKRLNALVKQRREQKLANETAEERKERLAKHAQRTAELRKARKAAQSESAGYTSSTSFDQSSTSRSALPRVAKQICTVKLPKQFSGDSDSDDDNFTSLQKAQSNNTEITMRKKNDKEKNVRNELGEHIYSNKRFLLATCTASNLTLSSKEREEKQGISFEACEFFTDDATVQLQTGIDSLENLCLIFRFLEDRMTQQSSSLQPPALPLFEQFCLTLMCLRLNLEPRDIAMRYNLLESYVSSFVNRFISDMMDFLVPNYIQWEKREDMSFVTGILNIEPLHRCVCIVSFLKIKTLHSEKSLTYLIAFSLTGMISYVSVSQLSTLEEVELLKSSHLLRKISDGDQLLVLKPEADNIEFYERSTLSKSNKIIKLPIRLSDDMFKELLDRCQSIINAFKFRFDVLNNLYVCPSHPTVFNSSSSIFLDRLVKVCCALHNINLPVG